MRILAFLFGMMIAQPLMADGLLDMTPDEKAAFHAEIRAYLIENPEILLEITEILEDKQADEQTLIDVEMVQDNADSLFNDGFSYVGGNPDGDITVVEFLDYQCGFCKRAHPDIQALVREDTNIRYVVKELPILGPSSTEASRAALAVLAGQGEETYKKFNDMLMRNQNQLNGAVIDKLAADSGVDVDAMHIRAEAEDIEQMILHTRRLAGQIELTGTPTFVIGDTIIRGFIPLEDMEEIVANNRDGA